MDFTEKRDNFIRWNDVPFIRIMEASVENPFFSITIPTFNRPEDLKRTIQSAINQDSSIPYEIVVVDNNPERDDDTEKMMKEMECGSLSYFKNSMNVGMVGNWNRCLIGAKGKWIVYCHDDDILEKTALSSIYKMIKSYPQCKAIASRLTQVDSPYASDAAADTATSGKNIKQIIGKFVKLIIRPGFPIAANLFCDNIYGPPTCGLTVERESMLEFGGWWDGYIVSDWITMIAFSQKYKVVKNKNLTGVYVWKQNTSLKQEAIKVMSKERREIIHSLSNTSRICKFYVKILKSDFDRKSDEDLTIFNGKRSIAFKLIRGYYGLRVR